MVYEIVSNKLSSNTLSIPIALAASLGIESKKTITLSFGKRRLPIAITCLQSINKNNILVSEDVITKLLIDTKVKYELLFSNNELIIGPVIGLLLGKSEKRLEKYLNNYLIYTMLYEQINGVLFVFCEEQIDFTNEIITGYLYDPSLPDNWRKCEFPFPGAIFRRVELSQKTLNGLKEKMGEGFFNSQYFDKWQFWNWLSPFDELKEHLAETTNKVTLANVEKFLEKYNGVYLKLKDGSRGKGIYYIEKVESQYVIMKNYQDEITELSKDQMIKFLSKHSIYLLQQPIRLHTFEDRKVDYRVILQKNETGHWQCTGIIARFGNTNAISSNFKANGFALEGTSALKTQFGYDELTAFKKYQEIIRICTDMACKVDEIAGSYGDLGIDVGIDEDDKIWVIEMNKRPDHDFPLIIKDRKMYYLVKSNPVLYAKYIAMRGY
ncbi:YheC/YheD family protein [Neobacillus sp. FSL H8-0543]|uniref:YheC/YheD family endospore coat-associated protein n=1 Tax=Neobacillus sp. FSL H8-0543 TaxID=2954672 RepID=UPI003158DC0D